MREPKSKKQTKIKYQLKKLIEVVRFNSKLYKPLYFLLQLTAAESRQKNGDCSLMNFYDSHDIWHLLSAAAMFLTFVFLLNLDDDLATTPQDQITVF